MVESNNGEERLSRIERMIEQLQQEAATTRQESAAVRTMTAKLIDVVMQAAPSLTSLGVAPPPPFTRRRRARTPRR